MAKKLLIETIVIKPSQVGKADAGHYLVESSNGKMVITLPMTVLNKRNLNDRIYSTAVFESAIPRAKTAMENRELLSSVNEHPTEPYVTPGEASHVVTEMWIDGDHLMGKWEILETTNGKNLRALVDANVSFGVSIRGLGSTDYDGNILAEDYEILGCDCVGEPSAQLRVRPEVVKESSKSSFNRYNPIKESDMKDKKTLLGYISEQKVLMENDIKNKDQINALKRAAAVEDVLAESQIPNKDLAEVYANWESTKEGCFKQINESKDATGNEQVDFYKKVLEQRNKQLQVMAKGMTQMTEQLATTKKMVNTKLAESNTDSDAKVKVAETAAKTANAKVVKLTKENAELGAKVKKLASEGSKKTVAYTMAIKEAAKLNVAYKLAVKEAAKLVKGKKLVVKVNEAKAPVMEAADFSFFTDVDYQTFAGADRPFGKMEPMVTEGDDFQMVLAGTEDGTTQLQVFAPNATWSKTVNDLKDALASAALIHGAAEDNPFEKLGWTKIGDGFMGESKAKSFKVKKSVTESKNRVIPNKTTLDNKEEPIVESAIARGEHVFRGWI